MKEKPRILVAEDEAVVAMELETTLQEMGYQVAAVAYSGEEAVRVTEQEIPDLVLMDIRIRGELSGVEAAKAIRSRFNIPLVFLTAHMDEARIEQARESLPFGYVLKPFHERNLQFTIEMALYTGEAEIKRRRTEEKFEVFFNAINDAVFVHPLQEEGFLPFIEVNDIACERYGYSREEFLKLSPSDITDSVDATLHAHPSHRRRLKEQNQMVFETRHIKSSGDVFPVEINANVIEYSGRPAVLAVVRDITERKHSEKALYDSEKKYRTVIENANEAILILQGNEFKYFNRKTCELSGYSEEELRSHQFFDLIHPDDRSLVLDRYSRRQDGEILEDVYVFRVMGKNGNVIWAEIKPVIIEWAGDVATLCFISDITERREAAEKLRASEQTFRSIVESSPMGIHQYKLEPDGRLVFVGANPAADQLLGLKNEQFIGMTIEEAFPPLAETEVPERYRKAAAEGRSWHSEQIEYADERIQGAYEVHAFQMTPGNMAALFYDITERKQAEQALKNSEERFNQLADNIKEVFWIVSPDWKAVYYLSPAFREIWQIDENDVYEKGLIWTDSIIKEDRKTVMDFLEQIEDDASMEINLPEFRISRPDGDIRWILARGFPVLDEQGNRIRIAGIAEDITIRKKTREMMVQTEKMTSIGGMAAGMAHELNNPLGGMLQGAQTIRRRFSPDLKANIKAAAEAGIDIQKLQNYLVKREIYKFLDGIRDSGRKASDIISNMLQFSRRSESRIAPTNIVEVVEKVLELAGKDYNLKKRYDFRNIKITRDFDADLPLVPCTETEIEQVLINLLLNSAWAMVDDNSQSKPEIIIRIKKEAGHVRLEVEDNGPGMDNATRKRIFEPFFTTKPVGEGTGLGLSVSYMIITNNHGGTMMVESDPGRGATFIIRLPLKR